MPISPRKENPPVRLIPIVFAIVLAVCSSSVAQAAPILITFDDQPVQAGGFDNNYPGNTYDPFVLFSTLNSIPDAVATIGDMFTAAGEVNTFRLITNAVNAVSDPNFAAATNGNGFDVLFFFPTPVSFLSLQTDATPNDPDGGIGIGDTVRLFALNFLGAGQYEVIAADETLDNATSLPDSLLQVSLPGTGFSYALFQTTTEQEGFDDVYFTPVPEPATIGLLTVGVGGLVSRQLRRRRAR
jgi:hypothetical protein